MAKLSWAALKGIVQQEGLDVRPLLPPALTDESYPRLLDELMLHLLIPSVRERSLGTVGPHVQPFGHEIGGIDAGLPPRSAK